MGVDCVWSFLLLIYCGWFNYYSPVSAVPMHRASEGSVEQFWQLSDLHLDATYHLTDDHTKVCASSKGWNASKPGIYGDFMCDSPYQLILSALNYMKQTEQQASFMIWTGDSPPHVPENELSTEAVINCIGNLTSTILNFFPDIQVFPSLGNHDYWPQDQLPVSVNEVYSAVAKFWKPWLTDEAISTLKKGGFYSQLYKSQTTQQSLRVISLNTNLYYSPNHLTVNMTDPASQFEWLEHTLESSFQKNEKVYIIAHVPIGYLPYARNTTAMRKFYNERLVMLFRKYSSIIAGQFYGHTHRDSLMVLLDEKGIPVNSLFVAPAVTPIKGFPSLDSNNPGIRLYQYDPTDYSVKDLRQYFLNLTEANIEKKPIWKLEYIMTNTYSIQNLQPESLYGLVKQFREQHSKQFQNYYKHFLVSYDSSYVCEGHCKTTHVCAIQYLDEASYTDCITGGVL
ncbi:cyclic GMP-AMP phosphodiesterase SMPDL3A [Microcaecilia unicolor]|uniref:Acid sphingomyelinase-like phosphodiesterase n=1 Tax=Microcaecilia unicolor TaxID=1415580 RepID=A0A6P7XVB8_9AMPH|nr:acid sphingomyelinase-like phosphodiesterase 3a [Microcaecilia unicolor]